MDGFGRSISILLVVGCSVALAQTKQEHVHHVGQSVMPFDLAKTTHILRMTDSGGVERVIAKDSRWVRFTSPVPIPARTSQR